jgi:RNA polymerase sigma-70 factor (ECF subfamily)
VRVADSEGVDRLVEQAAGGDAAAWQGLVGRFDARLRRMVAARLNARLQARLSASDVVQETYLVAAGRLPQYAAQPDLPFYLWLRMLAGDQLARAHRYHIDAKCRDATRDVPLDGRSLPEASSAALAAELVGPGRGPQSEAERSERVRLVQQALESLDAADREVLALRHFEQLTNAEAAVVLATTPAAAGKRYVRALLRIKKVLAGSPATWDDTLT